MDRRTALRGLFLSFSLFLLQTSRALPLEPGKIGNMDVFGVTPGSITELQRCFGEAAREYLTAASTPGNGPRAHELETKLEEQIKAAGGFEAVEISAVHYFQPNVPSDLTFNITPKGQKPSIVYMPEPKEDVPDPDGLLASWRE